MEQRRAVLVTGAASGIGAAAVRAFAGDGWAIVAADVAEQRLRSVADGLRDGGAEVLDAAVDVRDTAALRALVEAAVARFGALDAVCANAGVLPREAPLADTTDEEVALLLDVNLRGTVNTLRAALPHVRDGGSVVVTSSTSGLAAHPNAAVYAATKLALIGLARSLALEVAPRRIRVNAVCPGGVDTALMRSVYAADVAGTISAYEAANPLGRIAQPEDVAAAMLFLASPAARHVNGVALRVDGGDALAVAP